MTPVCRVLPGYEDLAALQGEWHALCDECPGSTAFQRPDWLLPWSRHLGADEPWLIAVYAPETGSLVGLAPLFRYHHTQRVLAFAGAGVSDYLDVLARPGWERAVVAAVLAEFCARRRLWDVCELDEVPPGSPLLSAPLPPGWQMHTSTQSACPVLDLPARVDELDTRVPGRHLRRFHQYRRRAERAGALRLERATSATQQRLIDALFELHAARWQRRGEAGVLADASLRAFHREVAAGFAWRNALALYALHLDDRVIACLYGLEDNSTLYFYLSGFDPRVGYLSPGVVLLGLVIEDAVRRGLSRFDFLRGNEPYKLWWGARERHTMRLALRWPGRGLAHPAARWAGPASKRR